MPMRGKTLLVIIVSTNDGIWLEACFNHLSMSSYADCGVLVIANCCDDDTVRLCNSASIAIEVIETSNRKGFAECNNIGLRFALESGCKYAFLLNPDTKVHPKAIRALVDFLELNKVYGIVGSQQIEYNSDGWSSSNSWTLETINEAQQHSSLPKAVGAYTVIDHYFVQGAALMLRLSLVPRIGLLDPIYRTFYEETDLCRRCLLSGHQVGLVLSSRVKHYGGGNWKRSKKEHIMRDFLLLRNQFFFYLSITNSSLSTFRAFITILIGQIGVVTKNEKEIVLPLWRYPSVLLSFLSNFHRMRRLKRRNMAIMDGQLLKATELAID